MRASRPPESALVSSVASASSPERNVTESRYCCAAALRCGAAQCCAVRYIAPILVTLEASLHSPACLYQWTVKPPMAPLDHIADIPAVGQELNRVIRL